MNQQTHYSINIMTSDKFLHDAYCNIIITLLKPVTSSHAILQAEVLNMLANTNDIQTT